MMQWTRDWYPNRTFGASKSADHISELYKHSQLNDNEALKLRKVKSGNTGRQVSETSHGPFVVTKNYMIVVSSLANIPTDSFTILEPQNPSHSVFELHKISRSPDREGLLNCERAGFPIIMPQNSLIDIFLKHTFFRSVDLKTSNCEKFGQER